MPNLTNIPAPRTDFIDPRTGKIAREWYLFLLNNGIKIDDIDSDVLGLQVAPSSSLVESFVAILDQVKQTLETLPALALNERIASLENQIAELQKTPPQERGDLVALSVKTPKILGTTVDVYANNNVAVHVQGSGGTDVNALAVSSNTTGNGPILAAQGSDPNVQLNLRAKGTGSVYLYSDTFAVAAFQGNSANSFQFYNSATNPYIDTTAGGVLIKSATKSVALFTNSGGTDVNFVALSSNVTGVGPVLTVDGSDANIQFNIRGKATGAVAIGSSSYNVATFQGNSARYFKFANDATNPTVDTTAGGILLLTAGKNNTLFTNSGGTDVNYISISSNVTATGPIITAAGETNVTLHVRSKGSGNVVIGSDAYPIIQFTGGTGSRFLTVANSSTDLTIGTSAGQIKVSPACVQITGSQGFAVPSAGAGLELIYDTDQVATGLAKWNSADKGANVVLSGGDLIVSKNASNWQSVRSVASKSSGKWYWEVTVTANAGASGLFIGIGTSVMSVNNYVGADAYGWGWQGGGASLKYTGGVSGAYGTNYVLNDVIGVALDLTAGTITFYLNNATQGVAYSGLSGTFFAAASCYTNATDSLTANFGASAFVYTPPSGHSAFGGTGYKDYGGIINAYDRTASQYRDLGFGGGNVDIFGDTRIYLHSTSIRWGANLVNAGGGAGATLNTIGGSGPATALQNSWCPVVGQDGIQYWFPVWK